MNSPPEPVRRLRRPLAAAVLAAGALLTAPAVSACRSPAMDLVDGRLAECPGSPNCVSSESDDPDRRIEPLPLAGAPADAWEDLQVLVAGWPGARLVTVRDDYLHAAFRTTLLRFVDDVEFRLDAEAGVIHLRSASRLGYSDLGANRRRAEALRAAWIAR